MIAALNETQKQRRHAAKVAEDYVFKVIVLTHAPLGIGVVRASSFYSRVDGMLVDVASLELLSLFEIKCRNVSTDEIRIKHGWQGMMDCEKLNAMQQLSEALQVPSRLFICTMQDGIIHDVPVTNRKGGWELKDTQTATREMPEGVGRNLRNRRMATFSMETSKQLPFRAMNLEV